MLKTIFVVGLFMSTSTIHASELVKKMSPYDVQTTMDRLANAIEGAGAKIFARVDHAAGAESIDAELRPNQMILFGNPKIGTPIMQQNPAAGLDLPIRVVVYSNATGNTVVSYHAPTRIADDHRIDPELKPFIVMSGALDKLTNAAVAE